MSSSTPTLGIDFGTSNSAAGYMVGSIPVLVEIQPGETTIPSTFFFDFETRQTLLGEPANRALLQGFEGRFMRALKRVLGTSLMHEKRQILNEQKTFVDIISGYLRILKIRAEAQSGQKFDSVLSGRPVYFHGKNDAREKQAEDDLRACYLAAGFEKVDFMFEPEAAAIASGALDQTGLNGLIVDIGGGTSDFSVFRSDGSTVQILANHGVRFGGTDFDRAISLHHVMPLLGAGTLLKKAIGPGTSPVPRSIFVDLATWEKIPFLYNAQNRRMARELVQFAVQPTLLSRLDKVLENELGHDIAFAVEDGKIATNLGKESANINLREIEPGLVLPLSQTMLNDTLGQFSEGLLSASLETLRIAGLEVRDIDRVIYVGGSSLMGLVTNTMTSRFPTANHSHSEVFTAVTNGLALAASRT